MIPTADIIGPTLCNGEEGADMVPLPAVPSPAALPLLDQVREFIRASKAQQATDYLIQAASRMAEVAA